MSLPTGEDPNCQEKQNTLIWLAGFQPQATRRWY